MDGCHGAFVPGIHGLKHVESLFAADLADDDPVRPHSQTVDEQLPLANPPQTFDVRRPCLESHGHFPAAVATRPHPQW